MSHTSSTSVGVPPEVEEVFLKFRTCEMSTLARDGSPITWPTMPFWRSGEGRFLITTSIGLPHKAFNIRRDPRVSLLFSNPTASGLTDPPAVLVQGDAEAPDEVETTLEGFEDEMRRALRRQPAGGNYSGNPLMRYLFDWYYMRLMIHVTPRRILWWPGGYLEQAPREAGVDRVG